MGAEGSATGGLWLRPSGRTNLAVSLGADRPDATGRSTGGVVAGRSGWVRLRGQEPLEEAAVALQRDAQVFG